MASGPVMARLDLYQRLASVIPPRRDQAASCAGSQQLTAHAQALGRLGQR